MEPPMAVRPGTVEFEGLDVPVADVGPGDETSVDVSVSDEFEGALLLATTAAELVVDGGAGSEAGGVLGRGSGLGKGRPPHEMSKSGLVVSEPPMIPKLIAPVNGPLWS